jgi:predicted  nucleic acid-binding Zn-ribbon protein
MTELTPEQVEALQQENKQLQAQLDEWKYEVKCHMDEVIAREKQIEQLQEQAARMKEALRKAKEVLYNLRMPNFSAICEALTAIDKVIGGEEI